MLYNIFYQFHRSHGGSLQWLPIISCMVPLALIEMIQKIRCIICTVSFRQEITVNRTIPPPPKNPTKSSHPFLKRGQNYDFAAPPPGGGGLRKI